MVSVPPALRLTRIKRVLHGAPAARQVHVLVIGETARADRFPLNGYARSQPSTHLNLIFSSRRCYP
jgi:glucan phosphoethanolaminetransferase (alkaline phosphatase superfamily)